MTTPTTQKTLGWKSTRHSALSFDPDFRQLGSITCSSCIALSRSSLSCGSSALSWNAPLGGAQISHAPSATAATRARRWPIARRRACEPASRVVCLSGRLAPPLVDLHGHLVRLAWLCIAAPPCVWAAPGVGRAWVPRWRLGAGRTSAPGGPGAGPSLCRWPPAMGPGLCSRSPGGAAARHPTRGEKKFPPLKPVCYKRGRAWCVADTSPRRTTVWASGTTWRRGRARC
jgi:hypothetical protein